MIPEKVTLKQIPDAQAEGSGLAKYGKSRMPRTFDKLAPAKGDDGRVITGLDEDSIAVNNIHDPEEREEVRTNLKALRESLESKTGLDLGPFSPYWSNYYVDLSSDNGRIFNKSNPKDVIAYHVLIANCYAAPTEEKAGEPKYQNAKYFMHTTEQARREKSSARKEKKKAAAILYNMSEDKDRMLLIGQYLYGKKFTSKMKTSDIYDELDDLIEANRDDDVKRFLKAEKKSIEELQFKVIVDKAISSRIIKYTDGYYQRGQVTLGKTLDQVYTNLMLPEFSTELMSIKEEIKL